MADKERIQLNLRLDGRQDLLDAIKEAAKGEDTSVNAWAVAVLAEKLGMASKPAPTEELKSVVASVLDELLADKLNAKLDKALADKLATLRTEPVGELAA